MCPGWILHTFSCLSWITRKYWGPVAVLNFVEYGNDLTKSLNFTFRNLVPSAMLVPGHILLLIGEAAETPHPCSFRITSLSVVYAGSSKNDTTVSSLVSSFAIIEGFHRRHVLGSNPDARSCWRHSM